MMKTVGIILVAIGIGLFGYIGYDYYMESQKILSPIPREDGPRIVFITPTQTAQ